MVAKRLEAVIWDFNGTLIDDLALVVESVNPQLEKQGLAPMTTERYRRVFGFPVQDYYRRLGVDFEKVSMTQLASDFFEAYEPGLRDCPLHDGVLDALDACAKRSIRQFVLSAMEESMLRATLETLGILDRFAAAYGLDHQEGDSKTARGRRLLSEFSLRPEATLMVGDTDHDAEVAAELGMTAILVSCGHQSEVRLRETGCRVVRSVRDLIELLD